MKRAYLLIAIIIIGCGIAATSRVALAVECSSLDVTGCSNLWFLDKIKCASTCKDICISDTPMSVLAKDPALCETCKYFGEGNLEMENLDCANSVVEAIKDALCDKGPKGCCISTENTDTLSSTEKCKTEKEECIGEDPILYNDCCFCTSGKGASLRVSGQDRSTKASCEEKCKKHDLHMDTSIGAGNIPDTSGAAPSARELANIDARCFTQAECAGPDYGRSPSQFRPGFGCTTGKGRCVAPEPDVELSTPLGSVTTVKGLKEYIAAVFNFMVSIIAVVTAIAFVWGGFRYIFGSAFTDIARAKEIMIDAGIGMILALGAVTLLQTINPATLKFNALDVFMINKQILLQSSFCTDLEKTGGKNYKFADAGKAPDEIKLENAKFNASAAETVCDREYYIEGLGKNLCSGRTCAQGVGYSCVTCRNSQGKIPECGHKKTGSVCINAQWTGTITWDSLQTPSVIFPIIVCNDAKNPTDYDVTEKNIFNLSNGNILFSTETASVESSIKEDVLGGSAPYRLSIPTDIEAQAVDKCKNGGGVKGILLTVYYVNKAKLINPLAPFMGGPGGGTVLLATTDNRSAGRLSGYANITTSGKTEALAFYCSVHRYGAHLQKTESYWSIQELKSAGSGEKPIFFDINLNSNNAPDSPMDTIGNKCDKITTF
ncbi:MAG: pilin [Patescibacteria group bacterium]